MSYGGPRGGQNYGGVSVGKGTVGSAVDERVQQYMGGGGAMGGGLGGGGGQMMGGGAPQRNAEAGPTAQEIVDYARYIGMDPIGDVNLLWIAEEALCASLPEGWTEHADQNGNTFYYNAGTGQSSWEHPLDEYYRSLFLKLKKILIDNRAAVKVNDSAVQLQCAIRSCYSRRIFRRLLGKKRLDDAASDIQAVYRGHLVRLKVREESIKQWEELEKFSSMRIQATYRAHLVRRGIAKKRDEWKKEWRRRASTKLQATWRGHVGRRIAREEEMYQALELDEYAVTKLQAVYRGHLGRDKFRAKRKQLAIDKILLSAAKIQAVYRGHLARLEANAERELQMAEIEFEAALRVQAVMRGHWGRQLMRFRRRNFLAAKLQSVYRGHIARLDVMVLRRFNAANALQAVYRGHVSRRFMVHHRQVVAIIRLHEWEQACALKLQSVFRGHQGRIGGFRLIRQTRSALRLQATYRGHLERARLRQSLAEEYAAVQVQRVYNGHVGRLAFRRLRTVLGAHKAALNVQRVLRAHWVRLRLAERGARGAAALTLQRVYRGHLSRTFGGEMPRPGVGGGGSRVVAGGGLSAARHAALTLQRVYRGHLDRLVVQEIIKQLLMDMQAMSAEAEAEEDAVLTLQLATRCHHARAALRVRRVRTLATRLLQGAYRAHLARTVLRAAEEERARRVEEAQALAERAEHAPSPVGSQASRASEAVSQGSQTEGQDADGPGSRQFFMHPITPMEELGDPTERSALSREHSRRSQRSLTLSTSTGQEPLAHQEVAPAMRPLTGVSRPGDGEMEDEGDYPRSMLTTAADGDERPTTPTDVDNDAVPAASDVAATAEPPEPAADLTPSTLPGQPPDGDAAVTARAASGAHETQSSQGRGTDDNEEDAGVAMPAGAGESVPGSGAPAAGLPGTAYTGPPESLGVRTPASDGVAAPGTPASFFGASSRPATQADAQPQQLVLAEEPAEQGELVPLVELAGGREPLSGIVSSMLGDVVRAASVEISASEHSAPTLPEAYDAPPTSLGESRPVTQGSAPGAGEWESSIGTEEGREALEGIAGASGAMVDGVLTQVSQEFPDSMPASHPTTPGADSLGRPGTGRTSVSCTPKSRSKFPIPCIGAQRALAQIHLALAPLLFRDVTRLTRALRLVPGITFHRTRHPCMLLLVSS